MIGPMTIVELRASNVKRLRAVSIHPDERGRMVVLGGKNGQGKTSVLDAISMALGGERLACPEPLRRGAETGEVVVDLGQLVVTRRWTKRGTSLVVSSKDGARYQSPQAMLDGLCGALTFDPLSFMRQPPKKQAELLRQLVGLDTTDMDIRRELAYVARTAANKETAKLQALLGTMPNHEDNPQPVSTADLAVQLSVAKRSNRERAVALDQRAGLEARYKGALLRVADLRMQLEAACREAESLEREVATPLVVADVIDEDRILAAISAAGAVNKRAAENARRNDMLQEVSASVAKADELSSTISSIDAEKAAAIAAAKMPVEGLAVGAAGVTMNGLPFEQASAAEQLRVSIAIGMAMNPKIRVLLIRDASLLDEDSVKLVGEMAAASGCQLWLERVENDEHTTVLIEDGQVLGVNPQ